MKNVFSALALLFTAAQACSQSVVDDTGLALHLQRPAQRVISLAPNLTELVFAAGGGPKIVGVSRYSNYPTEARQLPSAGDAFTLNLERIVSLHPDLILVWGSGLPTAQRQRLEALHLPVYISEIRHVDGIANTLQRLGVLLGTQTQARAAAAELERQWQALRGQYAHSPKVKVFYQAWGRPLMTVNGEHIISEAIKACGGVNIFADLPAFTPSVSWEATLARQAQVVITDSAALSDTQKAWQVMSARAQQAAPLVIGLNDDEISRMGPRFVHGAQALCAGLDQVRSHATQTPSKQRQAQP